MVDALLGTIGVAAAAGFGSWAVVLMQRKNSNGGLPWMDILRKSRAPVALPVPVQVKPEWATPTTDDIFSIRKDMVAVRELAAVMARDVHEPAWPADLQRSIADLAERLDGFLFRTATSEQRLEALEAARLATPPPPDLSPVLWEISERLESALERSQRPELMAELASGLVALPELVRQLSELLAAERSRTAKSAPQGNAVSQGSGQGSGASSPPPPPRRPPPTITPLAAPVNLPMSPSIPAPYVAGSVFIPANTVTNLLALIQQTLSPNCPGSATEFCLEADDALNTVIYVGAASSLGGPLSASNYGYRLKNGDPLRIYRAAYPGGNTAIGEVQVFATAGEWLHVEVQS